MEKNLQSYIHAIRIKQNLFRTIWKCQLKNSVQLTFNFQIFTENGLFLSKNDQFLITQMNILT